MTFDYRRLTNLTTTVNPTFPRLMMYDGATAVVNGSTATTTVAEVKAPAFWATTVIPANTFSVDLPLRTADIILVKCTSNLTLTVRVQTVNATTKLATVVWMTENSVE